LIGHYVELYTSSENYKARCPFHADCNPSFVVYPKTQTFYCFGCRERGDVLSFLMRRENLTFPEALDALRNLNG
jgi:DNA primase